jgi:hypothetical protein
MDLVIHENFKENKMVNITLLRDIELWGGFLEGAGIQGCSITLCLTQNSAVFGSTVGLPLERPKPVLEHLPSFDLGE